MSQALIKVCRSTELGLKLIDFRLNFSLNFFYIQVLKHIDFFFLMTKKIQKSFFGDCHNRYFQIRMRFHIKQEKN